MTAAPFQLGQWVVPDELAVRTPYMVVDCLPDNPFMILARIDPHNGEPAEIESLVGCWRPA